MQRTFAILSLIFIFYLISIFYACQKKEREEIKPSQDTTFIYKTNLSAYGLFKGNLSDLVPADHVEIYELSTTLFTDYSEKQRLIKLPANTKLTARGDSLPIFPDGTIIAKTFYYYNDLTDLTQGKRIIETRLLIKHNSTWRFSAYKWNTSQTEAYLLTDSSDAIDITWKQLNGVSKNIQYRIPTQNECVSCHSSSNIITPIGPKLRNMNRMVERNGSNINLLQYLQNKSLLNAIDISSITHLPDWADSVSFTLEERGRAYLDVNCAHCHSTTGMAANTNLQFSYELPLGSTGILDKNIEIINRTKSTGVDKMPKLGTTILHDEGVQLIRKYIQSL
jgi:uncharacterized repeat protein (TIGR03806 family)